MFGQFIHVSEVGSSPCSDALRKRHKGPGEVVLKHYQALVIVLLDFGLSSHVAYL